MLHQSLGVTGNNTNNIAASVNNNNSSISAAAFLTKSQSFSIGARVYFIGHQTTWALNFCSNNENPRKPLLGHK